MKTGRDRYLNDPQFKALVDQMMAHIRHNDFTPSEMRDAAMTASLIIEMNSPRITIVTEFNRLTKRFPELKRN